MEKMQVLSPLGRDATKVNDIAPRLADLNGKIVGEVWNGVFKGDVTFPVIRRLLKSRYPGVTIIPYTEFYHMPGSDVPSQQRELEHAIVASAKEKRCDALIFGNGA